MSEGYHGVINQHARACPSHYLGNALSHVRTITMNRTSLASSFLFTKLASVQSLPSIVKHLLTVPAKTIFPHMMAAIKPYHQFHRSFFFLYSCHQLILCFFAKVVQASAKKVYFQFAERSLPYAKIVQASEIEKILCL